MLNIALDLSSTLSHSKSSFLAAHTRPSGKPYASLVVGAAIFQPFTDRILLLKRSPAEKLFPHHWEIPGGKVDDTDNTIWDALKREVNEETGLSIKESDVTKAEMGFEWTLGEDVKESDITQAEMGFGWGLDEDVEDDTEMASEVSSMDESEELPDDTEMALAINFMVDIEELPKEVKLDPQEHLESLWANKKDIVGLKMTPEMRDVVEDVLDLLENLLETRGKIFRLVGLIVMVLVIAAVLEWLLFMGILSRETGEVVTVCLIPAASLLFFLLYC